MTEENLRWCVLIPCSARETWAVPQICLAEIYTLHTESELPPEEIDWRDHKVPVLDLGADDGSPWRESRRDSGLIAIFLGLEGEDCEYWGVAVRGDGLTATRVPAEEVKDVPDAVVDHATAAFEFKGVTYQVPDLAKLQKKLAESRRVA
jgi:hypothetical protein